MTWLEMSRDEEHGGGSWAFTRSLWSPTRKTDGSRWSHWMSVSEVAKGDPVLHLRGVGNEAAFVGYSIASTDGYATTSRPPNPGQWENYSEFYRVHLDDFIPFPDPIFLSYVFAAKDSELRAYFLQNKSRPRSRRERLFYVIQANRLQCLNGAYLSEASSELVSILLDGEAFMDHNTGATIESPETIVTTGIIIQQLRGRMGQADFAAAVRHNYSDHCCFPGCNIAERSYLIGAHIARWADRPDLRGNVSNGLCLCLMHDRAFEKGFFTLDFDNRVYSTSERLAESLWAQENIASFIGDSIRPGSEQPSHEALLNHYDRVELYPE